MFAFGVFFIGCAIIALNRINFSTEGSQASHVFVVLKTI
jgi:hypothetical protein